MDLFSRQNHGAVNREERAALGRGRPFGGVGTFLSALTCERLNCTMFNMVGL